MTCDCAVHKRCLGEPVKEFIWRVSEYYFHANVERMQECIHNSVFNSYTDSYLEIRWSFMKKVRELMESYSKEDLIQMFVEKQHALDLKFIEIKDGYVYFDCKSSEHVLAYNQGETPILTNNQENFMGIEQGVGTLFGCSLHRSLSEVIGDIIHRGFYDILDEQYGIRNITDNSFYIVKRKRPMYNNEFIELLTPEIIKKVDFEVVLKNGTSIFYGTLQNEYKYKYVPKGCGVGAFYKFYKTFGRYKNCWNTCYMQDIDYIYIKKIYKKLSPEEFLTLYSC